MKNTIMNRVVAKAALAKKLLAVVGITTVGALAVGGAASAAAYPPKADAITAGTPSCTYAQGSNSALSAWSIKFDYAVKSENAKLVIVQDAGNRVTAADKAVPVGTGTITISNATPGLDLPAGFTPYKASLVVGTQTVATVTTVGCVISVTDTTGTVTTVTGSTLPSTGGNSGQVAAYGVVFLSIGAALLLLARQRRAQSV